MDGFFEFALERYNYWIVIVLMMTGLYTVFARGNLVKKIVGLNLFQTSVFIFYITIGKIAGGTAPIYMGADLKKLYEGDHGDDQGAVGAVGDESGKGHGDAGGDAHGATSHDAGQDLGHELTGDAALHSKIDNSALASNDLKGALNTLEPTATLPEADSLHAAPSEMSTKIANDALAAAKPSGPEFDIAGTAETHGEASAHGVADGAHAAMDYVYSNPLPHVLILTAIVVGVATTAVGLALAVRIREAYGTIEEDELEAIDEVAEFGDGATFGPETVS